MVQPRAKARTSLLLTLLLLFALSVTVRANAAPTIRLGGPGGLVVPATTDEVRIERERLSFDLTGPSPVAQASYELVNVSGQDVALELLFISPIEEGLTVALDGRPLDVRAEPGAELPEAWRVPRQGMDPISDAAYDLNGHTTTPSSAYAFAVQLEAGARATLEAGFRPWLSEDHERHPYRVRHLTYVLGPAKNWAGFGTLEVSLALPGKYLVASSPALQKVSEGEGVARYQGSFDGIPAEVLTISTISAAAVAPRPLWEVIKVPFALGVPVVAAVLVGVGLGGWLSRIRRAWLAGLVAGGLALVATAAIGAGVVALVSMPNPAIDPEELSSTADYGRTFLQLLWAIAVVFALPALAALLAGLRAGILSARRQSGQG